MSVLGKVLVVGGAVLLLAGLAALLFSRLGWDRFPGDLTIAVGGLRIHLLLGLSLVISVIATLVIAILRR